MAAPEKMLQLELFRSVLDRAPVGVCIFLPVGRTDFLHVYVNPPYQALKPYRPMLGRLYSEVWPELAANAIPYLFRILDSGITWSEVRQPFDVKTEKGVTGHRYYTREISRVVIGDEYFLIATAADATTEVQAMTERRRVERELHRELTTVTSLLEAAQALTGSTDLDHILKALMGKIAETTGRHRIFVSLYEPGSDGLVIRAATGPTGQLTPGTPVTVEGWAPEIRRSLEEKRPAVIDYTSEGIPEASRERARVLDVKVMLSVPLVINDRLTGFMALDDPGRHRRFSARETRLIEGMAAQAAVAIENARLFIGLRRSTKQAEALNRVNEAVHSTLSQEEVMERAVEETARAVGMDGAALHLRDGGVWRFAYTYGLPEDLRRATLADDDAPLSSAILRDGHALVVHDARIDERANRQLMSRFDIRSLIGQPLIVRGEPFGVLFVGCLGRGAQIDPSEVDFVGKVASTLALAIENARLYETARTISETLQQALLSMPGRIGGVDFAHAYRSASEEARVGGDFYDIFELEHDLVGVLIGDVAGKGLDAAVLTSLLKNTIRAHATDKPLDPAEVVRLTNELVFRSTTSEAFVTVFFGVLDLSDGSFVYCNAGHPAPIVVHADGRVSQLPPTSTVVGAMQDAGFAQAEAVLASGDLLFAYTDGLIEAKGHGELFGERRLRDVLSRHVGADPDDIVDVVVRSVTDFSLTGLTDDVAVLAVRPVASGGELAEAASFARPHGADGSAP